MLVPQRLSSRLLTLAEEELFEPRRSARVLAETERTMIKKLGLDLALVRKRIDATQRAFPEAEVIGHERLEDGLTCHPKDRHVLAAAILGEADTLLTTNPKDFPEAACRPFDIAVLDPDTFLLGLISDDETGTGLAVQREAERMKRPPMSPAGDPGWCRPAGSDVREHDAADPDRRR